MKILYDHQIFQYQRVGGISKYFAELIRAMQEIDNTDTEIICTYSNNQHIADKLNLTLKPIQTKPYNGKLFNKVYNKSITFRVDKLNKKNSLTALQQPFDVFHPTYYNPYFLSELKKPFVITVHDMIHERFPELFLKDKTTSKHKRLLCEKASRIIAISHSTKRDLIEFFNIPEEKIDVIYHGVHLYPLEDADNLPMLTKPYFLYVGSRGGYKNYRTAAKAFAAFSKKHPDSELILAGAPLDATEEQLHKELGILKRIKCLQLNDHELQIAYKNAIALIYPSRYEGFGMPILEAFAQGCPVICSNTSSMPEVGGEWANYFEPMDDAALTVLLKKTFENPLVQQDKNSLKNWAAKFTWERCASTTLQSYNS